MHSCVWKRTCVLLCARGFVIYSFAVKIAFLDVHKTTYNGMLRIQKYKAHFVVEAVEAFSI